MSKTTIVITTNIQELLLISECLSEISYGIQLNETEIINRFGALY